MRLTGLSWLRGGEQVVLKGAAHHPWLDERDAFVTAVSRFLGTTG